MSVTRDTSHLEMLRLNDVAPMKMELIPLLDCSEYILRAIEISGRFQAVVNGTFELCFGLWQEYKLTGREIRRHEDKESKRDYLMI